jgi:hypothetical protein
MVLGQAHHDPSAETQTIPLWENGAPGALGQGDDRPTLTLYRLGGLTYPVRRS